MIELNLADTLKRHRYEVFQKVSGGMTYLEVPMIAAVSEAGIISVVTTLSALPSH